MKLNMLQILFHLTALRTICECVQNKEDVNLIADIVNSYDTPTYVIGKICWPHFSKVALAAKLGSLQSPKLLQFVDQFENLQLTHNDLIMVDAQCSDVKEFLYNADQQNLLKGPYRWLLFGGTTNSSIVLGNYNILLDSEVLFAQYMPDSVELYYMYKISAQSEFTTEYFGSWTSYQGLRKQPIIPSIALRRKNLRRTTIASSLMVVKEHTETNLNDLSNADDTTAKHAYRILSTLCDLFMNATNKILFTRTVGYYVNGSWNGMIGDVLKGDADIAGAGMYITPHRLSVLQYLTDPFQTTIKFVFRQPPLSYQYNLFVLPFTTNVWYCFLALIPVVLVVLYANAVWEREKGENEDTPWSASLSDMMMMVSSMISQQGSSIVLAGTTGRLVMLILLVSFMFLFVSYSANIVALLQASSTSIRTLADLANSRLELGAEDAPYSHFIFKDVSDPVRKKIYSKIMSSKQKSNYMTPEEGIKRIQSSRFAFHMLTGSIYKLVERHFYEHEKCDLQEISFMATVQRPWVTNRKGSPYHELLKIGFYRIREHGISDRENKLIFTQKPECQSRGGSFVSVTIVDVYPAMLLLVYGAVLSLGFLGLEIIISIYKSRKLKFVQSL